MAQSGAHSQSPPSVNVVNPTYCQQTKLNHSSSPLMSYQKSAAISWAPKPWAPNKDDTSTNGAKFLSGKEIFRTVVDRRIAPRERVGEASVEKAVAPEEAVPMDPTDVLLRNPVHVAGPATVRSHVRAPVDNAVSNDIHREVREFKTRPDTRHKVLRNTSIRG